jgi:hypothetical protein
VQFVFDDDEPAGHPQLFKATWDTAGNLPPLPAIFPGHCRVYLFKSISEEEPRFGCRCEASPMPWVTFGPLQLLSGLRTALSNCKHGHSH